MSSALLSQITLSLSLSSQHPAELDECTFRKLHYYFLLPKQKALNSNRIS